MERTYPLRFPFDRSHSTFLYTVIPEVVGIVAILFLKRIWKYFVHRVSFTAKL